MASEPPSPEAAAADDGDALFKELDAYPWDRDNIFQVHILIGSLARALRVNQLIDVHDRTL